MIPQVLADSFWSYVDRSAGPDRCWPWLLKCVPGGYGRIDVARKHYSAHRTAYELATGDDPASLWVLHRCDNRPCCNPNHLFKGTCQDNHDDMVAKGRGRGGSLPNEAHPAHKYSDALIAEARAAFATGAFSQRAIGRNFGITHPYVTEILRGDFRKPR